MRNRIALAVLSLLLFPLIALAQAPEPPTPTLVARAVPAPAQAPVGLPNGTTHSVSLTCTPSVSTGVTGYNWYRATSAGGEAGTTALNGSTPTTGCAFTDSTVVGGTKYFYVVSAAAGSTQSAFSNEVSVSIPSNPSPPTALTVASFSIVPSSNGKQETITATYTEPNAGAQTAYQLWSSSGLLKQGKPSVSANGTYTITWTGKVANAPMPSLTVEDDLGQVATSDKGE